ncbi:sensor histidine kinase [Gordonibacter sp. 28C]|uniref:sensor histidine kinase n=1 Tax=Gordonibacter sp. 28C TaxID=2078569 RepID=UPI0013144D33|nr:sensor histidine kinase [Gordonibacter sp. 28C]
MEALENRRAVGADRAPAACGTEWCPAFTARSNYERELRVKEATIREVHHRVKNNLQTIESLLRMQMRRTDSPQVVEAFTEAVARIGAMSVAHEMLSFAHAERVDAKSLALAVANQVKMGLVGASPCVRVVGRGRAGTIGAQGATSFALAVAEIVHNAIEHGLAERDEGTVALTFLRGGCGLTTFIEDDGWGLPSGFSLEGGRSMGLVLMRMLVEDDLGGTITCGPGADGRGTRFIVTVPLEKGRCDEDERGEGGAHEDRDR